MENKNYGEYAENKNNYGVKKIFSGSKKGDIAEFNEICHKHQLWLIEEEGGERADFSDTAFVDDFQIFGKNLERAIFRGARFESTQIYKAIFKGADFSEAALLNVIISNSNFEETNCKEVCFKGVFVRDDELKEDDEDDYELIKETSFYDADFYLSHLNECTFLRTNFASVRFTEADLCDSGFRECEFSGSVMTSIVAFNACFAGSKLNHVSLQGSILDDANFKEANLYDTKLSNSKMQGVDFTNANCCHASFSDCNLRTICIEGAKFKNCNFTGTKLQEVDFRKTYCIQECDFTMANLKNAGFEYCDLKRSVFRDASLRNASFRYADLSKSDFTNANCSNVDFHRADIADVIFYNTDLYNAKICSALNKNAVFDGAALAIETLPDDIDERTLKKFLHYVAKAGLESSYIGESLKEGLQEIEDFANPSGN